MVTLDKFGAPFSIRGAEIKSTTFTEEPSCIGLAKSQELSLAVFTIALVHTMHPHQDTPL
jgi:hypothetical protein